MLLSEIIVSKTEKNTSRQLRELSYFALIMADMTLVVILNYIKSVSLHGL